MANPPQLHIASGSPADDQSCLPSSAHAERIVAALMELISRWMKNPSLLAADAKPEQTQPMLVAAKELSKLLGVGLRTLRKILVKSCASQYLTPNPLRTMLFPLRVSSGHSHNQLR